MAIYFGTINNDTLTGSLSDDFLYGEDGNDTLDGGAGSDFLYGGAGNDIFMFGLGYGLDWIYDSVGSNTLKMSVLPGAVTLTRNDAYGVTLRINGTDQITIGNWFLSSDYRTTQVQFSDLSVWNAATISTATWGTIPVKNGTESSDYLSGTDGGADTINGLGGNDVIYSYAGNDTLDGGSGNDHIHGGDGNDAITGGAGNDELMGENGNDTYFFGIGSGEDMISDTIGTGSDLNILQMSVLPTQVTLTRLDEYGGVTLKINGTNDQVTLDHWFYSTNYQAFKVIFSDLTEWNAATLSTATWGTIPTKYGTAEIDYLFGTDGGADTIDGMENDDGLYGYGGNDTLLGGSGNDDLMGGFGNDTLNGGSGNDNLYGQEDNDILIGNSGNDTLYGGWGSDTYQFSRGAGQDTVVDAIGNATDLTTIEITDATVLPADIILERIDSEGVTLRINGSTDQITLAYFFTSASYREVQVTFASGGAWNAATLLTATWGTIPAQTGSDFNDALYGTDGGADTIYGMGGDDTIFGYAGNDTLEGGDGNDAINPGAGNDTIKGGLGTDTLYYTSSTLAVAVNLATLTPQVVNASKTDTITGIENLVGSFYADTLTGDANNNLIDGGPDNDTMSGGAGIDTVSYDNAARRVSVTLATQGASQMVSSYVLTNGATVEEWDTLNSIENLIGSEYNDTLAGDGNANTITGGYGDDSLSGGAGIDTVSYADAGVGVTVSLAVTAAQATGWGSDTISLFENLTGSAYNDTLSGNANANVFDGGAGTDTLSYDAVATALTANLATGTASGGGGADTILNIENLTGGTANDTLTGNGGDNVLDGNTGADTLTGGLGNDTYIVDNASDTTVENLNEGTDLVTSSITWTLAANVENLRLLSGAINGTGNTLNNVIYAGSGDNTLDGATGTDTLSYADATAAITASLALATAQATGGSGIDTISNFENLTGSAFDDTLGGDGAANILDGGVGHDVLTYAAFTTAGTTGVTVNLVLAMATGWGNDTIYNFEDIVGSAYDDTLSGSNHDNTITGGAGNDTMDGGWGSDTLSYATATAGVTITLASLVAQNTIGAGIDTVVNFENITGSAFNDTLSGDWGNNILDGGGGADTLIGGTGNDTYYVDNAGDVTTENLNEGTDLVITTATLTLGNNLENLRLGAGAINGTGNGLDNLIYSGTGNNTLNGGAGIDTVSYLYATAGVTANLTGATGGAGTDILTGFENLTGSAFNDSLSGDVNANLIDGGAGTDTLNMSAATASVTVSLTQGTSSGAGGNDTLYNIENVTTGSGNDTVEGDVNSNVLDGGTGTDTLTYVNSLYGISIDLSDATAQESGGGGYDTIANFENVIGSAWDDTIGGNSGNNTLNGGAGINTLSFIVAGSTVPITVSLAITAAQNTGFGTDTISNFHNVLGGAGNDSLTGNAGDNVIDGRKGSDTMIGGAGNDTYWVSVSTDVITELVNEGIDEVYTMSAYTMAANVENLYILTTVDNLSFSGNTSNNIIYSGTGYSTITGGGGTDTISYYYAVSSITANLATGTAIETGSTVNETITGFTNLSGGAFDDTLSGSTAANTIFGDEGNDILNGNTGNDTLTGGDDQDTFVFNTALNAATNVDTITDFSAVDDVIHLENTGIFTMLTTLGTLSSANFAANATGTATDANDYVLYNTTTGALLYDSDGTGATAAIQFALLGTATHPTITSADFTVI